MPEKRKAHIFNRDDLAIWDSLFAKVPLAWKEASATPDMEDCAAFLHEHDVKTVLDVGCGVGLWSIFLRRRGFRVKGFDFSANAIAFARQWAAEAELEIEFACDPVTARPFGDIRFGAAVAAKILDNVAKAEAEAAVAHLHDALREGGVMFCLFNPHMTPEALAALAKSENPTAGATQINYRDEELMELFPRFDLLEHKTYEHGFRGLFLRRRD